MVMLMCCLSVAYACLRVSPMVSFRRFSCSLLKVSYWFLMDSFGKDITWDVLHVCVFYVSLSLSLYTFSVGSLLCTHVRGVVAFIWYVLPMNCIHLLCGVPAHCLDSSMEFPQGVPCDHYASLLG